MGRKGGLEALGGGGGLLLTRFHSHARGCGGAAHLLFSTTKMCGSLYSAAMLRDS